MFLLGAAPLLLHAQLRINELQAARVAGSDGQGPNGDWVELHHGGAGTMDLGGHVLALQGRSVVLPSGLAVPPGGRIVLWCDGSPEEVPGSIGLDLPRTGGTLLLVAPDRSTVLDVFTWPALPAGVSIGRKHDGAEDWGFFAAPSPGRPNGDACSRLLAAPSLRSDGQVLFAPDNAPGAEVRYRVDGMAPGPGDALLDGPVRLDPGTVVRARSFAPDAVPSPEARHVIGLPATAWGLVIDADDLHGPQGIADTASGNHARKGRAWQRQAWLQRDGAVLPVGLAIAGSGSRSLPKRNFKLLVRDRFNGQGPVLLPDSTAWRTVFLRADGSPHAFMRNTFMEVVARRSGNRVDVQPGHPTPLYLNGRYQGLYRAMPGKGKEWLQALNGGQPVEIIEGPAGHAVEGDDKHYRQLLDTLLAGGDPEGAARMADLESLIELACLDLWTGRADHDLNVRCWRPAVPGGRWRWVLFDMDQWAPPADRTVDRMCGAAYPETPFVPQLLADAGARRLLLARMSALCATTLGPEQASAVADSIHARHRAELARDHLRWKDEMPSPGPEASLHHLMEHVQQRNAHLLGQLAQYTGHALRLLTVQVEPAGAGSVAVEGLRLTGDERSLRVFEDVPLQLTATAGPGMEFAGWRGAEGNEGQAVLAPQGNRRVIAEFRPAGLSRQGGL